MSKDEIISYVESAVPFDADFFYQNQIKSYIVNWLRYHTRRLHDIHVDNLGDVEMYGRAYV